MGVLDDHGGWAGLFGDLTAGSDLDPAVARAAMAEILAGEAGPARIAGLLVGLRAKGASPAEVAAMVDAMLSASSPLELPTGVEAIDIVGTGGSAARRSGALNVSTGACFIAAGAGATVCKHGNRRASSTSGSFDVLEALGLAVELDGPGVARCVAEAGIGFCFARTFHPAMRHAAPVRAELGIPTVFNLLGPLSHPAGLTRQVVGVSDGSLASLVLDVLVARGATSAMVVHGHDGLDELSLTGVSTVHEVREGAVRTYDVDPGELGLERVDQARLVGGDPAQNAEILTAVLAGEPSPAADIMVLNAAAGLVVAEVATDLADGVDRARASISSGAAATTLERLRSVAGRPSPG